MSILTPQQVLGPGGLLAEQLEAYESRPQQLAMAELVAEVIDEGGHAIVEAPTGVGKSFAYVVRAARWALEHGRKVVISTGTIALQEQLVDKDLPVLQSIFPELNPVLVKGRQNYLSRRRLEFANSGQQALFEDREQVDELRQVADWAARSDVGDRADLGYDPDYQVWRLVQSDKNNCLGRRCPHYQDCFFYQARARIEDADILVVNHHLYFADLSLRDEHAAILPPHDVVIFDEAHALEDIATEHLGSSISEAQVRYWLDGLWNGRKGLLADQRFAHLRELIEAARAAQQELWGDIAVAAGEQRGDVMRIGAPDRFGNPLSPALDRIGEGLVACRGRCSDDNELQELRAQAERGAILAGSLRQLIGQKLEGYVYYANVPRGRGSMSLTANPLSVADPLKNLLFDETRTVVLTSATLAADDSERFLFLRRRLGIEGGHALRLDSPFDFQTQARLLVNETPIDPNGERFERAFAQWLGDFLEDAPGGTFVLFTSYRQLNAVHELLRPRLDRSKRFVLRQGDRMGRSQMLDLFKATGNAVLFGTASFWEGVDVRGDALQNVVIAKLPFEVPDHPLIEARLNDIKRQGGNPFMERTVPEAILRLKQGIGRLIRTGKDTGTIAIADHRVLTKRYGRYFIRALPEMPLERFRL